MSMSSLITQEDIFSVGAQVFYGRIEGLLQKSGKVYAEREMQFLALPNVWTDGGHVDTSTVRLRSNFHGRVCASTVIIMVTIELITFHKNIVFYKNNKDRIS